MAQDGPSGSSQHVRFCQAPDGVRIAYAVHGQGPALLISTCWLSHLQFDWESPVWRHFLADLGRVATVIRFDERGHGLSDWDVTDHHLEARVGDLEAVADAAGLERFALMAMAQGGPVAVTYAARHPERISRLLFYNSYAAAAQGLSTEELETVDAMTELIRVGWARPDSTFRRVFTSMMIPGATEEQKRWLDDLLRVAASASTAYLSRQQRMEADADSLLPTLDLPTLVLHSVRDQMNPFHYGRHLATNIPGARLVGLDSDNHILLADEPAWPAFMAEVEAFLEADRSNGAPGSDSGSGPASAASAASEATSAAAWQSLSERELEVLRLAAMGNTNDEIAAQLHLSIRTVERHLQNVYGKLGLQGRSARITAAARFLSPS